MTAPLPRVPKARAFDIIVLGGLTAGTLDILDGFAVSLVNGGAPVRVLHAIASGVLGRTAYQGERPRRLSVWVSTS